MSDIPLMSELPEGWINTNVGEISTQIQYGYTASASNKVDGPRFLRITDIQDGLVDWNLVPSCEITTHDIIKFSLAPGDIVFARTGATTGKSYLIRSCPPAVFASYLIRLRPKPPLDPLFLSLFFQTPAYWQLVSENVSGNAQPNCNASKLAALPMPLPPLAEQKRIVAKVEALLACVNAARQRLAKVPVLLKRFRQAVLAAACSGQFTEDWREEIVRSSQESTFVSVLSHVRRACENQSSGSLSRFELEIAPDDLPQLPTGWSWIPLRYLGNDPLNTVQTGPFGAQLHNDEFVKEGVPVIAVGNLTGMGFSSEGLYFITSKKANDLARYDVQAGDLLFARSGATLGKVCIAPEFVENWRMTGHILRARLARAFILPNLAVFALWGDPIVRAQVFGNIRGITRPGFNTKLLESIWLPVPPLAEQHEIVRRVEALFARADTIEAQLKTATRQVETLTQAILAQAFRGELVPTEAELARREGREYEPASVLLERIHNTRAEPIDTNAGRRRSGTTKRKQNLGKNTGRCTD